MMRKLLRPIAALICAGVAMTTPTLRAAPSQEVIDAIWKPQSIEFDYRSEGRTYSCDVLEYKITTILKRLGARDGLRLHRNGCHDLSDRARFEVLLESPVEATESNIREVTSYDSQAELVARVRGVTLASANDIERFPAAWATISFRRDRKLDLDAGDCSLVQQLRRQVLPRMSVQVTADIKGVDCTQELSGFTPPRLTVTALLPSTAIAER